MENTTTSTRQLQEVKATPEATDGQAPSENANISGLENANISKSENANIEWEKDPRNGDARYFQTGAKRGQLKPSAAVSGLDSEKGEKSQPFSLKVDALQSGTRRKPKDQAPPDAKPLKAEKKAAEARVGAKMAMRILDVVVGWISGNQYGADFTKEQREARNAYREELESNWQEYLMTLDIPMSPALVVAFGSVTYVAEAFNTPRGKERADSLKQNLIGKAVGWFFK